MKLHAISALLLVAGYCTTPSQAGWFGSSNDQPDATAHAGQAPPAKFDYKQSFKKPYLYNGTVPFWSSGGDVIMAKDFIRLAPSVPGSRGWLWSDQPNPYEEWMVHVAFRVTGSHMHGGRGLAFWYTKEQKPDGPIFGGGDQWDGLAIWLDSANPQSNTPTTMALLNDGTTAFAGRVDPKKFIMGQCSINYRNTGNMDAHLSIKYKANTLTVMLDPTGEGKDYRTCLQKSGINLPTGYHFGISAASSNPADDHDITSFQTFQLDPPAKVQKTKRPLEEEKIAQGQEFKELTEEQKKKIEEAEYEVRRMREEAEGETVKDETSATLAAVYDTQRRIMEDLQIMQMQVEAIGAPSPDQLLKGNFEAKAPNQQQPIVTSGDNKEIS
ncbi:legume-like lectin family-domain-containing protein [Syncephalastrum racemosum]|uniref:Legume-like lectin family-domain-containing protein n=1 Tax=Syncephalastrum racemosum TaxID=13706 RepID=A0A1X2HAU5_SYNRA|nr:legume-like lectin family-domain-containing protein [Syncephalastrum racemosum]